MFVVLLAVISLLQATPECSTAPDCRQQAIDAATAGDYERFHDLAWRAVQKGRPNDPDLMYVLARAQSLSGRPGDAIVMLERLTQMGIATDAATNDDFRRVRALKNWPELEAKMTALVNPTALPKPPPSSAPAVTTAPPSREPVEAPEETLAFTVPRFDPVGLAYDAVSRRFIVGDHTANRLLVIDELSHHVTPLVSAASAGFYEAITAFEIDVRRGDLWVASVNSSGPESVVHKLQLVSGRVLEEVRVGSDDKCRIGDLAVLADGTILALDSRAGRIFRLQPGSRRMDVMGKSAVPAGARSFTLANDRLIYVASDEGITRVDLQTKEVAAVRLPKGTDLGRIEKIRWHDGGLVIVTRTVAGESQIQRARMDSGGQAIARLQVLTTARDADPRTVTLSGPLLYYMVGGNDESTIRRTRLR
jgi:hypothetical protein